MSDLDANTRFMIDFSGNSYHPYALFVRKAGFFPQWKKLDDFREREEAVALYEKVKDLPEYLP